MSCMSDQLLMHAVTQLRSILILELAFYKQVLNMGHERDPLRPLTISPMHEKTNFKMK